MNIFVGLNLAFTKDSYGFQNNNFFNFKNKYLSKLKYHYLILCTTTKSKYFIPYFFTSYTYIIQYNLSFNKLYTIHALHLTVLRTFPWVSPMAMQSQPRWSWSFTNPEIKINLSLKK
jgi:hypothetical protein